MAGYKTRQRELLLNYLQAHPDEALTAGQIADALAEKVSRSTVYRTLAALEREGRLSRTAKAGDRERRYRYSDAPRCRGCLHLNCMRCGRTMHMAEQEADQLAASLAATDGFALSRADTVIYGLCAKCRK